MTLIATLSYSIYLLHKGVVHVTQEFLVRLIHVEVNGTIMLLICTFTCVCAAGLMHILIEKPFMNWRKKIIQ
jgi:peptidoglycan/LPS O-acetylase OafA/YrhL